MSINQKEMDAVVLGAGFAGMYMLHLLRESGYSVRAYEAGGGVGGTWYWNRYPGAGCDVPSLYYCYTFSEEIYKEWTWSSKYPSQPELLKYANFVAERLDLLKDIQFNARVLSAHFDENLNKWRIRTNNDEVILAKYFITGVGPLTSASNLPNIKGINNFKGAVYHTGRWPHEGVDFKGKRVGVIGTGSSGVQAIPVIANEAESLTVFQRTPQWVFPTNDYPLEKEYVKEIKENFHELRRQIDASIPAFPVEFKGKPHSAFDDTAEERQKHYDKLWKTGDAGIIGAYVDITTNETANEDVAKFIRSKIKEVVENPITAEKLLPSILVGARRPIFGKNYYETFNRENVSLVDLRDAPIEEITTKGILINEKEYELDILVFATGFDALTGPLLNIDIRGRNGVTLRDKWDGLANFKTNLAVANSGFPNMFTLWGPHSSALFNALRGIELHVEWVFDCIEYLRNNNVETIETTVQAEDEWTNFIDAVAVQTIQSKVDSWYHGTNVEGKLRKYLMYFGDFPTYKAKYDEVATTGYEGFVLTPSSKIKVNEKL
ncbi:NAD(P)/FAD-dependent oxidoreductase [Robertmurraya massiliosenegalensis]|uniref:flavin-containing monooxygenase n=1 Tax=Robertmurraya TaxID=2837507 RepID=UPI0039A5A372